MGGLTGAQRSFEDLGTPLSEVTFCVVDLETTGGSPERHAITEIGAVKVRRGELEGTLQTLVHPGVAVPAFVRLLTGITDDMLVDAPSLDAVLPTFLEFAVGTVLVAHNAHFDVGFLNAACTRLGYEALAHRIVDTAGLARRVLAGEVPNRKLETLARHFRCPHKPSHRALTDALATTDVLHNLIERLAGFGVTTLEDLLSASFTKMDGTFAKITLADEVPSSMGVYRFLGHSGETLYVGKASDLRARVRSYFYGDQRARMRSLLRETQKVVWDEHATMLEAEVAEARAIAAETPPYNRAGKRAGAWYLKLSLRARTPRVSAARVPKEDGSLYVGPYSSRMVRGLIETLRDSGPVHRCNDPARCRGCAFSQMNACHGIDPRAHRREIARMATGFVSSPTLILDPLHERMRRLAGGERFEEAAELRRRAAVFESSLAQHLQAVALIAAGDLVVAAGGRAVLIRRGHLAAALDVGGDGAATTVARLQAVGGESAEPRSWMTTSERREARVISSWLNRNARSITLLHASQGWSLPVGARFDDRFSVRAKREEEL
ncbi:MAG: DEDD exonuclease domain-containing protein [Actinomycetota bacterium]